MDELYCAIIKATWYDDYDGSTQTDNFIITEVKNYTQVMAKIEEYVGEILESVEITLLEGPFCAVSSDIANRIVKGEIR